MRSEAIFALSETKFLKRREVSKIPLRKEGPGGGRLNVKRLTSALGK